jgi:alpha-N-acetylglucosaminidase
VWTSFVAVALAQSTQGIIDLVARRLPSHADAFEFLLTANESLPIVVATKTNDEYRVSSTSEGKILVEGNSLSAISSG